LELRRPRTRIFVAAIEEEQERRYEFFRDEGLQWVHGGDGNVPVWAWNAARRPFSLEWEACTDGTNQPFLKTLLYDIAMPLTVQIGRRPSATQEHSARRWVAWPLTAQDQHAAFTIGLGSIPLLQGTLGHWPGRPDAVAPARRKPVALERLVEAGITGTGAPLEGRHLAPWWKDAPPESLTPERLRLDLWTADPDDLAAALGRGRNTTGVLVRLDRRAILLGLSDDRVYMRLHAILLAIGRSGAVPVLVLNPEIDVEKPSLQAMALAFHRLGQEFDCPFIDLRKLAP
jgi:hypothetical protein